MPDAIVVGAGLYGATIARALRADGRSVVVFDNQQPLAGSLASGCLMKPSWFSSMGKDLYNPALETLDDLYGLQELEFSVLPGGVKAKVHWVPKEQVLDQKELSEGSIEIWRHTVSSVTPSAVFGEGFQSLSAPLIIVAAGVWSSDLIEVPGLIGRQGISFQWKGQLEKNFISVWAPYKHAVGFNDSKGTIWAGDGSSILPKNWKPDREEACLGRMSRHCKQPPETVVATTGIRPYIPTRKDGLLEERLPGLWVATGGTKNGMISAGWCAHEIVSRTS